MSIIDTSVKRPVGTIMIYIGIVVLGIISYTKLSLNLLPDLNYPKISVITEYAGSGPEEMERFVTSQLEGPLSSVPGLKKIESVSKEGLSVISLEFHWGTDMDFALLHTKEKAEEARRTLPDNCGAPLVMEWDPSAAPIMTVTLKCDKLSLKTQKETAEYIIKPRLEQLSGISRVEIRGGDDQEVSVEIDPEKIKNLEISLSDVVQAIEADNVVRSSGTVKKDKLRYVLKIEGEITTPSDIEDIVVKRIDDRPVLVKDIGKAFFKNKLKQGDIRFNGKESIALLLYKEAGGNTVEATKEAEKTFENLSKEFGKDIQFQVVAREAELIISAMNSLKDSLWQGALLALLVLMLFLQNWKEPLLISLVTPICIASTYALMFIFKVNLNIMSLGGLVLGVGMFVDNSIVVLEAIFRHKDNNESTIDSVIRGTKEVATAITGSTLTNIAVFLPVIFLYGIAGKMFGDQALTVTFSLMSSLVVAVTLLPALSAMKAIYKVDFIEGFIKQRDKKWYYSILRGTHSILMIPFKLIGYMFYFIAGAIITLLYYIFKGIGKGLDLFLKPMYKIFIIAWDGFDRWLDNILKKILDRKSIAFFITFFILVAIGIQFFLLKKELLPQPKSRKFEIKASTMPVFGFEQTDIIAGNIEKKLKAMNGVKFVFTEAGTVSTFAASYEDISVNSIHFIVECENPDIQQRLMAQATQLLNSTNMKADLQEVTIFGEKNTLSQYLSTGGDNFQVKIFYDDFENGKKAVDMVMNEIQSIKGLQNIKNTTTEGKPLYALQFKQENLNKFNIRKDILASYIEQAVRGEQAGTLKQIQKNYDILVRVPSDGTMSIDEMLSLPITLNNQTFFLKDLVYYKERPSIKKITRDSQERYFLISADGHNIKLDETVKQLETKLEKVHFPQNTRFAASGEEEERRKAFSSLSDAVWLSIILVYMLIALEFENFLQPLIIMFTVPMGLVGAFFVLLITGNSLNIISGIGILVLIGIVDNNGILKVEYSNQLREKGMGIREATLVASRVRLRPIMMSTLTSVIGLIPMCIASDIGSELQRPLALVVMGGLVFATILTLILISVFYEVVEEWKEKWTQKKQVNA